MYAQNKIISETHRNLHGFTPNSLVNIPPVLNTSHVKLMSTDEPTLTVIVNFVTVQLIATFVPVLLSYRLFI
jgi:hypothetical protein